MRNLHFISLCIILLMSFSGCDPFEDMFKSTGAETTEERHLDAIENVDIKTNVDLIIHHDSIYRMTVTAGSHLLEKIETSVEGNTLKIRNKNKFNWVRKFNPKLIVNIWVPSLKSILIYDGTGDINCADTLFAQRFEFNSFGGIGDYNLLLHCKESYLKLHTGPADLYVSGTVDYSYIYNAGIGFWSGENYSSNQTDCINRGINDVKIIVHDKLNATINSSGNIYYGGIPHNIESKITGSGKLIHL